MFDKIYLTMLVAVAFAVIVGPWYGLMGWDNIPWQAPLVMLIIAGPILVKCLIEIWTDK